ncbi:MAG: zinc-binding dehydrogenase [Synergistaceae bacterium]|jgi:L-iditol 2-dehydrogenase|nr:zinc-binding dehydrogenase [Synergistaceae bacterium]
MKKIDSIPSAMKALVAYGPNDFRYEDAKVPEIDEDEALIKSLGCGICAGDVKSFHGAGMFWGDKINPAWQIPPVNTGHEFFGEVVAVGENAAKKWKISLGDWIVPEQIIPCWECRFCKSGLPYMCQVHDLYGFQSGVSDGGMAEYVRINKRSVIHQVPKTFTVEQGVMIEPASCAAHTVERAEIKFNDAVVIAGMGPIGLCKLQFAKYKNPRLLIAIDSKPERLALAEKLGADVVINFTKEDSVKRVLELTGGYGCDIYIENSGHPSAVVSGLQMIRKSGTFVEFSVFAQETTVDWSIIGDRKELSVKGSHISGLDGYEIAVNFMKNGLLRTDEITTHSFPLSEWEEAYSVSAKGVGSIKVWLRP